MRKAKHRWASRPWTLSAWVRSSTSPDWTKVSRVVYLMSPRSIKIDLAYASYVTGLSLTKQEAKP